MQGMEHHPVYKHLYIENIDWQSGPFPDLDKLQ